MPLSKDEQSRLRSWLEKKKWVKCSHCGHGISDKAGWNILGEHQFAGLSVVLVECPDCFVIHMFSYERTKTGNP
jgi:hypothetical protein